MNARFQVPFSEIESDSRISNGMILAWTEFANEDEGYKPWIDNQIEDNTLGKKYCAIVVQLKLKINLYAKQYNKVVGWKVRLCWHVL